MTTHTVVVNDCSAAAVTGGPTPVRTRDTAHGAQNFMLNAGALAAGLPRQLASREMDWIEIVGYLFAVDLACPRGKGDVEWARDIEAHLPVRDPAFWNSVSYRLEAIFGDFTMDRLQLQFVLDENPSLAPRQSLEPFPAHDSVALVSGGVDSFVGAAQLVNDGGFPLAVAHTAAGAITHAQALVEQVLAERSPTFRRLGLTARKAGPTFPGPEPSQRSRSFLFLAAASVVAAVGGTGRVFINENGIMAIHLPMTSARIGSLSTHTASPLVVERVARLASDVLGAPIQISNQLVGLTKPEVVELGVSLGLRDNLAATVSCWSIGRTSEHCGVCAPCLMRRISFETHGVPDASYANDIFEDRLVLEKAFALDNLTHLVRIIETIRASSDLELQLEYPELLNGAGVLTMDECIALHRRWADEAATVLLGHTNPQMLR